MVLNYFSPVLASGKLGGAFFFANGPITKNLNFLMQNWLTPKVLKSHKVGEKKYPLLCICVGQENFTL